MLKSRSSVTVTRLHRMRKLSDLLRDDTYGKQMNFVKNRQLFPCKKNKIFDATVYFQTGLENFSPKIGVKSLKAHF